LHELDLHHIFELGLILILIAAGITAISKKIKQPYPIALVIVGAVIGLVTIPALEPLKTFITEGEVFNFVVLTVFLPALLGEAALKLPFSHLVENKKAIFSLAFGGTLLSFLVIGFSAHWLLGFPITVAFVFASVMSATDPVSVLSIFKSMGVKKNLATVIEGESLFNDGLAVVFFKISAFSLLTYLELGWSGLGNGVFEFVKVVALGLLVGSLLGYGASMLTKFFDDYPLEIIFSILLFYGSFLLAETIHASGVIAVVTGALIFGNYGSKIGMSPTTKLNINNFWDVASLLANSLVFLMVGLEITRINLADKWGMIGIAILIVLIGRSVAVYSSLLFIKEMPITWKHVLNWGGLKGSLSIALVLSLPRDFAGREDILILAFSVVFFSLVFQGITIKPIISFFGVKASNEGFADYERIISKIHRFESSIDEIIKMKKQLHIAGPASQELIQEYEQKINLNHKELEQLFEKFPELKRKQLLTLRKHALYAQHEKVKQLQKEEMISDEIAEREIKEITNLLVSDEESHEQG
jgi:monovalent cation:H+ antiporter, CPA1 family